MVHRPSFFRESNNGRKSVIDMVIVHPPITPAATIASSAAFGAVARPEADSKQRWHAGIDENHCRLVPFSTEAQDFIDSPTVRFLRYIPTTLF